MGKNDFDMEFDYEEEFGFDPKAFLGTEEYDENIDLNEYSNEELGLKEESAYEPQEEEEEFLTEEPEEELFAQEELAVEDFLGVGFPPQPVQADFAFDDQEELDEQGDYTEEEELTGEDGFEDDDLEEDDSDAPKRKERKPIAMPKINMPKITMPKINLRTPKFLQSFYDLYFAPVVNKGIIEEPVDTGSPNRRRRRKTKAQIFKEVYLPAIIVCVCLILVMSFAIGALSNFIAEKKLENQLRQDEIQASEDAASLREREYQSVMAKADELASQYNYKAAIEMLDAFGDATDYPDLTVKKTNFITAQQQMIEHREPSLIPNLSFHVLIEDLPRAMADSEYGGSYNKNFVSTGEFKSILNHLYANGYVLVNFENFVESATDTSGNQQYMIKPIYLPADKKPIMITETMVNYFAYMVDPDKDGTPDSKGGGFANKLVLQGGKVKAQYVDGNGQTLVGDYDLVPILESFIEEHPDFSYQGARATLAVTGYEGIFGYRTNTSYIASKGQAYYDQECADAKEVVQALRNQGYRLACFTYDNVAYRDKSAAEIQADLQMWTQQITPVIGEVDTLVFARTSNITAYDGPQFNVLHQTGFRFFVSNGTQPWAEVNTGYVRQNRLMVTGQNMQHYPNQFSGIFDCAAILDVNVRGNVPN